MLQQGVNQFSFACKVVIGDGVNATYFSDIYKSVIFTTAVSSGALIDVKSSATLTLGYVNDLTKKTTSRGCNIINLCTYNTPIIQSASSSYVNLYSCSVESTVATESWLLGWNGGTWTLFNCLLGSKVTIYGSYSSATPTWNIYNVVSCEAFYAFTGDTFSGSIDRLMIESSNYSVYVSGSNNFTFRNLVVLNGSILVQTGPEFTANVFLIDSDVDSWLFSWQGSSGEVFRQYSFDLFVLNGALTDFVENANVTITHDGTIIGSWLTNSTGQIATQTLTYGFYNQTGGDTMYGGTAWTLTITHPDWTTYTSVFYPYSKIEWSISMQDTSTADNNMVTIGLLLGGVAFLGIIVIRRKQS